MRDFRLTAPADVDAWRAQARTAIAAGLPPHAVDWQVGDGQADLFRDDGPLADAHSPSFAVPRSFLDLAADVVCHRSPTRFVRLYRVLWRIVQGEPRVLEAASDPDVHECTVMAKAVRRDLHKMKAFVRFRSVTVDSGEVFLAWFEPSHFIVDRVATFFVDRFTGMRWSILTPDRSAHWTGETLVLGAGALRSDAPDGDALEDAWRAYYASIFNPARLKPAALRAQMPKKYWKNLPEAALIGPLTAAAAERTRTMLDVVPTPSIPTRVKPEAEPVPAKPSDRGRRLGLGRTRGSRLAEDQ